MEKIQTPPSYRSPYVWEIWRNPIFLRYCRSRLRPRKMLTGQLLILIIVGFFFAMIQANAHRGNMSPVDAARISLVPVLFMQALILFIFGTAQTSGGMITEADDGTLDYQRLMPMTPMTKVLGYLFGLPVREYVTFLLLLPLAIWGVWKGQIPFIVAISFYSALLGSAILYHLTGLLTGTLMKNRRWAFLASIGLVFSLYTIMPMLSKFGLVFFKYLGVYPVAEENIRYLSPQHLERTVKAAQNLISEARFFGLEFPEAVFTLFCQSGLILAFIVMLYRRWRKRESLLLGKFGAVFLNLWIHLLLLGSSLPLVDSGQLFPTQGLTRRFGGSGGQPQLGEAGAMVLAYAIWSYCLAALLNYLSTASTELQSKAWRKANKYGKGRLNFSEDAATSYWSMLVMGLTGFAALAMFGRGIIESRWFPGHFLTQQNMIVIGAVFVAMCVTFQCKSEFLGAKKMLLWVLFLGVVPLMVAAVMRSTTEKLATPAVWVAGASPLGTLVLSICSQLDVFNNEIPKSISRAVPLSFKFWGTIHSLAALYFSHQLWKKRREISELAKS